MLAENQKNWELYMEVTVQKCYILLLWTACVRAAPKGCCLIVRHSWLMLFMLSTVTDSLGKPAHPGALHIPLADAHGAPEVGGWKPRVYTCVSHLSPWCRSHFKRCQNRLEVYWNRLPVPTPRADWWRRSEWRRENLISNNPSSWCETVVQGTTV